MEGEVPGELLDRFSLAQFQFSQLVGSVSRHASTLKYWVVHAARVDEGLARGLHNGLLSPKLLVEMEKQREGYMARARDQGTTFEVISEAAEYINGTTRYLTHPPAKGEGAAGEGILAPQSQLRAQVRPPKRVLQDAKDNLQKKKQRTPLDAFLQRASALR